MRTFLQDTPWPTDDAGVPTGSGCLECKLLVVRLFPHLTYEKVVELKDQKTGQGRDMTQQLKGARMALRSMKEQKPGTPFHLRPANEVGYSHECGSLTHLIRSYARACAALTHVTAEHFTTILLH